MNDDLEYVNSLEKELDELESEKADFSNIYDLLLEECVSKDDPINTSLHTIDHEIGTRKEKERLSCLERERRREK
ncbi:hypothetical protein Tco_1550347 [Tanacetum coccineum]